MRALVLRAPNDFSVEDVPRPEPGPFEVLCRVRAIAICGTDPHIIAGDYPGFWPKEFPLIPGHEWAGEVVKVGPGAAELGWRPGARVAGTSHAGCGYCRLCVEGRYNLCESYGDERLHRQYGHNSPGACADYVVHSVRSVFAVPDELSDEDAAMLDPASIALHTVKFGGQAPGDAVVVVGPGVMGLVVAECARAGGADVALECSGDPVAVENCVEMVRRGGSVAVIGIPLEPPPVPLRRLVLDEIQLRGGASRGGRDAGGDRGRDGGPDRASPADHPSLRARGLRRGVPGLHRAGGRRAQADRAAMKGLGLLAALFLGALALRPQLVGVAAAFVASVLPLSPRRLRPPERLEVEAVVP
jgi:L-iditol 2-dehydrogenase